MRSTMPLLGMVRSRRSHSSILVVLAIAACFDMSALADLQVVASAIGQRYGQAANINLTSSGELTITFQNSPFAELPAMERDTLAREVAAFAFASYPGRENLTSVSVGFQSVHGVAGFTVSRSQVPYTWSASELRVENANSTQTTTASSLPQPSPSQNPAELVDSGLAAGLRNVAVRGRYAVAICRTRCEPDDTAAAFASGFVVLTADSLIPRPLTPAERSAGSTGGAYIRPDRPGGCFTLATRRKQSDSYAGIERSGILYWHRDSAGAVDFSLSNASNAGYSVRAAVGHGILLGKGSSWGTGTVATGVHNDYVIGRRVGAANSAGCDRIAVQSGQ